MLKTIKLTKKNDIAHTCTSCFKNLGVTSRYKIYTYLKANKEATVGELVDHVNLTQPTVSFHLHQMTSSGLLNSKKLGKHVYYSVNPKCPHRDDKCVLNDLKI